MRLNRKGFTITLVLIYVIISIIPINALGTLINDSTSLLAANESVYSYENNGNNDTDKIIVRYKDGIGDNEKQYVKRNLSIDDIEVIEDFNMEIIKLKDCYDIHKILNELNNSSYVKYAEPSYDRKLIPDVSANYSAFSTVYDPNDDGYVYQWGMSVTQMVYAWQKVSVSDRQKITVAVVDTGVDYTHSELSDYVLRDRGYDFVNNDSDAYDDAGHGTEVAGIIGAKANNTKGIAGVASGVNILPVKVLDSKGEGNSVGVIEGLKYAVDHGAQVINLSLGGDNYSSSEVEAIEYALNRGVVVVAASGNGGNYKAAVFPASYPGVLSVGATNQDNTLADFSNIKSQVVAPGNYILSTAPVYKNEDLYGWFKGTSYAAPFVSGLAAMVIASSKDYRTGLSLIDTNNNSRIYQVGIAIENGCTDLGNVGFDNIFGSGLINGKNTFEKTRYFIDKLSNSSEITKNITVSAYDYTNTFLSSVSDSVYLHIKDSQGNIITSREVKLKNGTGTSTFQLDAGSYKVIADSKSNNSRIIDYGMEFTIYPQESVANSSKKSSKGGGRGGGFIQPEDSQSNSSPTPTPKPTIIYKTLDGQTFSDIKNHWAKSDIEIMAAKGVVKGISKDRFAPDDKLTRAQFAAFLVRALNLGDLIAKTKFKDVVEGSWYYDSVNTAFKIGIVSGISDTEFKPDEEITREQMSLMIKNAYFYLTKKNESEMIDLNSFGYKDTDNISDWAKNSAAFCSKYELMFGDENKYYKPKENATRAQAVAVIRRMLDKTGNL